MTDTAALPARFFVQLCSDKAAFEARLARRVSLNMNEVRKSLEDSKGLEIIVFTPHLVIVRIGRAETTLSRDGRMLIRRVANETEATQVAEQMLQIILKSAVKR